MDAPFHLSWKYTIGAAVLAVLVGVVVGLWIRSELSVHMDAPRKISHYDY